jgi:hypothetical protein
LNIYASKNFERGYKMLSEKEYVRLSLESNLFFLRIVKEHAIFAAPSLPPRDMAAAAHLLAMKNTFERLLDETISLSPGIISPEVLSSGELITELTLPAENVTQLLTGVPINTNITKKEIALSSVGRFMSRADLTGTVSALNKEIIKATKAAIEFQTTLLRNILNCKAFSYTYPTMLEHVTEESQFYVTLLTKLENKDSIDSVKEVIELEINWNHIMGEHSKFIRGYLDPSEKQLFETANTFSREFDELIEKTNTLPERPQQLPEVTKESLELVTALRDFKKQGAEGILACKVKSIIPPLLADHVTREANHYLRLLRSFSSMSK